MSKKFTKELVDDLADKLLIGLSPEENEMVLSEFDEIDANIDLINEIDGIEKVEPMTHCLDDFVYELREDVAVEGLPIEDILANSDDTEDREIVVPKVVG
ncbi:MAG: Asp-tRNA(Asn)/Glu-tRNA(Gln) amidotransferase subunit GatC [Firmicutes bacterium]|nr:Asp-tRNA(Asn)/Glu-tRNA(Gln) amidotransferase subunit GatC [Bacillota bacterium]